MTSTNNNTQLNNEDDKLKGMRSQRLKEMRELLEKEEQESHSSLFYDILEVLYIDAFLRAINPFTRLVERFFIRFEHLLYVGTLTLVLLFSSYFIFSSVYDNRKEIFLASLFSRSQAVGTFDSFSLNQQEPEEIVQEFVEKSSEQQFEETKKDFEEVLRETNYSGDEAQLLQPHPLPALVEPSEDGLLPIIGEDGTQVWQAYSRPYDVLDQRPAVGVIVNNVGLLYHLGQLALSLPSPMSLSFSPYTNNIKQWVTDARNRGHEAFLNIILEPREYPRDDPGPLGLLVQLSEEEMALKLRKNLALTTGYVGVVASMGEAFLQDEEATSLLLRMLQSRGVAFVDSKTTISSKALKIMENLGMAGTQADIVLNDRFATEAQIQNALEQAMTVARDNKTALILIEPYANVIEAINKWGRGLQSNNIALLPVTAIIEKRLQNR